MAWPWVCRRDIPHLIYPYQLQQIQATASSTGIQAQEMRHRARGPWGVATMASGQTTVHIIQRFLLGTCLLIVCLFIAEAEGRWVGVQVPAMAFLPE